LEGDGNTWDITVVYDARFSDWEMKKATNFSDGFVLWNNDGDKLTGLLAHKEPTTVPAGQKQLKRTLKANVSGDTLNAEWGQDNIFAVVHLHDNDINLGHTGRSGTVSLDP
jgi:hypothetical protein